MTGIRFLLFTFFNLLHFPLYRRGRSRKYYGFGLLMIMCSLDLLTPFGPIPTALDPNGVYPYVSYAETSNRPVLEKYRFMVLENHLIRVTICPDLGGKVSSIIHKPSRKEVLYRPDVIRYTRILPSFYFVAGGIEVSFPISHSPSQNEKILYRI